MHYPVILSEHYVLGKFYLRNENDTFTDELGTFCRINFDTVSRIGYLTGINALEHFQFNGKFILDTNITQWDDQAEDSQNPGTFVNKTFCCYVTAYPDSTWITTDSAYGKNTVRHTEWKSGKRNGWNYAFENNLLVESGYFVDGRSVGEHISPADEGRFVDHYDASGNVLGYSYLKGKSDTILYDRRFRNDSALVHFRNDSMDVRKKAGLADFTRYGDDGSVLFRSVEFLSEPGLLSYESYYPDKKIRYSIKRVDYYYEVRHFDADGKELPVKYCRDLDFYFHNDPPDLVGEFVPGK